MAQGVTKILTNRDVWEAASGIATLASRKNLKIKTLYWLGKSTAKLTREVERIQKHRTDLAKKCVKKDPNTGEPIPSSDPNQGDLIDVQALNAEFNELLDTEIEITLYSTNVEDIDKKEDTSITCPKCDKDFNTPTLEMSLGAYDMFKVIDIGLLTYSEHKEEEEKKQESSLPQVKQKE